MVAAILERARHAARPQPRRREHGRRRGDARWPPPRAAAGASSTATSGSSRSTSSGSGRVVEELAAARAACSPTCSATSSTATASSRRSPTAGPAVARRRAGTRARAQRRRPARRRPRPRRARARCTSASRTTALAPPELPARVGLQALPPLRRAVRLRRDLPRPPRPLPLPATAARARPSPTSRPRDVELHGIRARRLHARDAGRRARASSSRCPASTTSTTRSAPRRWRSRSAPRSPTSSAGLEAVAPAFGRAETVDAAAAARPRSCSSRTRPGANEVLRTLALEGGELDVLGVLNDRIADGRDVSWVWDADWELLAAALRRMTCAGTRAAELAAAAEVRGRRPGAPARASTASSARSTPRWPTASGAAYALPTYTALLELRDAARRAAARRREYVRDERRACREHVAWHDVECGGYDADLPLWRELAARRGGPVLDVGAGTGRVALDLARRRPRRRRARPRRRAARRAARARGRGLRVRDRGRPTPQASTSARRASRSILVRCRRSSCSAADRRARLPARAPGATSRRAACSPPRSPTRCEAFDGDVSRLPAPDVGERDGWRLRLASPSRCATAGGRGRASSASASSSRPTASAPSSDDVDRARRARRRRRSRPRPRPPASTPAAGAATIAATEEHVGSDGGGAAWLSGPCASARCIPT